MAARMHNRPHGVTGRGRRARGQSTAEFALAIPVFLVLLFGALEMGLLFKTRSAYQEAAQQAVRVAAAAGNATDADTQALSQLQITLPDENLTKINKVTIFKATVSGAPT